MKCQLIVLTIALIASVLGSPHHGKDRAFGYQIDNTGGSYGTDQHHEQQSSTNAYNSESEYQQNQYGGHLGSGSGHLGSSNGHMGSWGYSSGGGLSNGGFGHGIHQGQSVPNQGGLGQGGFGQGQFGQGGFGQGGSNHGGLGQGGLNHGGSHHQYNNFRSAGEIDGSSINVATDFPKTDEAIIFGNQPMIAADFSGLQQQTEIYEGGLSDGAPPLTPMVSRDYRKISSTAILPISYNEEESRNIPKQQKTNYSTSDHGSRI